MKAESKHRRHCLECSNNRIIVATEVLDGATVSDIKGAQLCTLLKVSFAVATTVAADNYTHYTIKMSIDASDKAPVFLHCYGSLGGVPISHLELSLLFDLPGFFDYTAQLGVLLGQVLILDVQVLELGLSCLKCILEGAITSNTSLLRQFLVLLVQFGPLILFLRQARLGLI